MPGETPIATPRLLVVDETDVTADLAARISQLLCVCFPKDAAFFSASRAWHGSAPAYSVIGEANGQIITHVGVVDRVIAIGIPPSEASLRVAGVQNVAVAPDHRGQRWVDRAMNLAMEEAARRAFDAGLLFCGQGMVRIYRRCGWRVLENRQVIRVDQGCEIPLPADNFAMFYPLLQADFPEGRIHLRGNDW